MAGDGTAVLLARYRLEARLGSGGMGAVWRATDLLLKRDVAVKLMALALRADPVAWERFRREAQYQAGLRHPGITEVYDYGEADGQPFIVLEFLDGSDLFSYLRDYPGGLPASRVVELGTQAAEALAYLHGSGLLHRDIKSANLFLSRDGQLKVFDFGVAKSRGSASITSAGTRLGTWAYLAPEVWLGEEATARADLYALGCVLHEMLTGQPPFPVHHDEQALRRLHLQDPPPPPRGAHPVPERLAALVGELMSKDPRARPASARDVADELRAIGQTPAAWSPDDLLTPRPLPDGASPAGGRGPAGGSSHLALPGQAAEGDLAAGAGAPAVRTLARTSELPPDHDEAPGPAGRGVPVAGALAAEAVPRPALALAGQADAWLWAWAARACAWVVFATAVALCIAITAGHLAPAYRLFVLVPAALYTLPGALAVSRATVSRVAPVALAFVSFCIAEAAAILVASHVRPGEAWSAVLALAWLGGVCAALYRSR
jgi:serine/threonine-protein kinase